MLPAMLREIIGTRLMIKKAMKRPEYKVRVWIKEGCFNSMRITINTNNNPSMTQHMRMHMHLYHRATPSSCACWSPASSASSSSPT